MSQSKAYIVAVQCHIVKERCSGYLCERAFSERSGAFSCYPADAPLRFLSLTCGGCCGRGVQRKLSNLIRQIGKKEGIGKEQIAVHLSSCAAFESFHGPECPHKDYLKTIICDKLGLDLVEGTRISKLSEKRRESGEYKPR
jgi:predicted metal-binding protein